MHDNFDGYVNSLRMIWCLLANLPGSVKYLQITSIYPPVNSEGGSLTYHQHIFPSPSVSLQESLKSFRGVLILSKTKQKQTPWPLVCKRTILTEGPPHASEVSANFCG
jgi:hypothetical protein